MKKKQAWKVMGAVLAGALILSDAAPLRASAASETENDRKILDREEGEKVGAKVGSS